MSKGGAEPRWPPCGRARLTMGPCAGCAGCAADSLVAAVIGEAHKGELVSHEGLWYGEGLLVAAVLLDVVEVAGVDVAAQLRHHGGGRCTGGRDEWVEGDGRETVDLCASARALAITSCPCVRSPVWGEAEGFLQKRGGGCEECLDHRHSQVCKQQEVNPTGQSAVCWELEAW